MCVHACLVMFDSCDSMDCNPPGSLCPWNFPGKSTRMGSHSLLQGVFPTQRWNQSLLLGRQILYHWATWEALNPVGPEQSAEEEDCPNQCNVRTLSRFSHVQLFATLWTVAHQALLSVGLSRQEHWSGLPCPPPGDLPHPGVEPSSHVSCTGRRAL